MIRKLHYWTLFILKKALKNILEKCKNEPINYGRIIAKNILAKL